MLHLKLEILYTLNPNSQLAKVAAATRRGGEDVGQLGVGDYLRQGERGGEAWRQKGHMEGGE